MQITYEKDKSGISFISESTIKGLSIKEATPKSLVISIVGKINFGNIDPNKSNDNVVWRCFLSQKVVNLLMRAIIHIMPSLNIIHKQYA